MSHFCLRKSPIRGVSCLASLDSVARGMVNPIREPQCTSVLKNFLCDLGKTDHRLHDPEGINGIESTIQLPTELKSFQPERGLSDFGPLGSEPMQAFFRAAPQEVAAVADEESEAPEPSLTNPTAFPPLPSQERSSCET